MEFEQLGRLLLVLGVGLLLVGGLMVLLGKIGFGKLPGDIHIQRENFTCFAPIVSMLLLSILLTIVVNVAIRFLNK